MNYTVYAAVYAAIVSRQVYEDGKQVSVSWEARRTRARMEAAKAVEAAEDFANILDDTDLS